MGFSAEPNAAHGSALRTMILASAVLIGASCTRTETGSVASERRLAAPRASFPGQSDSQPFANPGTQSPDGNELLPLLCPVCGSNGGGDTTDFGGSSDWGSSNAYDGCWAEEPVLIDTEDALRHGFHPDPQWAMLDGNWEAPILWLGTTRQTQLAFTIERTGRVLLMERYSSDAGSSERCEPFFREELRVSLAAADGSLEGQLEAIPTERLELLPTYRRFAISDTAVELRGNLELDIDRERQPLAIQISLEWYHLGAQLDNRVRVDVDVRYGVREGGNRIDRLARAEPVDGCQHYELPSAEGCVAIWDHPGYRIQRRDAGPDIEPLAAPHPDASVVSPPNPTGDAGARSEAAGSGLVPAGDAAP